MWNIFLAFGAFIFDACFNCAHWLFAFDYLETSRLMPFVFQQKQISEKIVTYNTFLFRILLALNIFIPFLEGITVYFDNKAEEDYNGKGKIYQIWNILDVTCADFSAFLQINSGLILIYAVYKIRKFLINEGKPEVINTKILVIHSIAFRLYMISSLIWLVFDTWFAFFPSEESAENALFVDLSH